MQANIITPLNTLSVDQLAIKNKELLIDNKCLYLQTSRFIVIEGANETELLVDLSDTSGLEIFTSNVLVIDNYFRDKYLKTVSDKLKFQHTIRMNKFLVLRHSNLTQFFNHYGEPMTVFKPQKYPNSFPALTEDNEITGYAIIKPMRLSKDRAGNYSLEWSVLQVRLTLPLPAFEECMLNEQDNCDYDDIGDTDGEEYFESI